jgi:pyruvate dehydrogenase complex dehydrogenase (E1) component
MSSENTETWALKALRSIADYKLSDAEALVGAENIWSNVLLNAYNAHAKNVEKPLEFDKVLEIQLDKLMATLATVRMLMEEFDKKHLGENVVPFMRKQT